MFIIVLPALCVWEENYFSQGLKLLETLERIAQDRGCFDKKYTHKLHRVESYTAAVEKLKLISN